MPIFLTLGQILSLLLFVCVSGEAYAQSGDVIPFGQSLEAQLNALRPGSDAESEFLERQIDRPRTLYIVEKALIKKWERLLTEQREPSLSRRFQYTTERYMRFLARIPLSSESVDKLIEIHNRIERRTPGVVNKSQSTVVAFAIEGSPVQHDLSSEQILAMFSILENSAISGVLDRYLSTVSAAKVVAALQFLPGLYGETAHRPLGFFQLAMEQKLLTVEQISQLKRIVQDNVNFQSRIFKHFPQLAAQLELPVHVELLRVITQNAINGAGNIDPISWTKEAKSGFVRAAIKLFEEPLTPAKAVSAVKGRMLERLISLDTWFGSDEKIILDDWITRIYVVLDEAAKNSSILFRGRYNTAKFELLRVADHYRFDVMSRLGDVLTLASEDPNRDIQAQVREIFANVNRKRRPRGVVNCTAEIRKMKIMGE